mgnify:CR=1 FL=1|jgi:hypothetical protein
MEFQFYYMIILATGKAKNNFIATNLISKLYLLGHKTKATIYRGLLYVGLVLAHIRHC